MRFTNTSRSSGGRMRCSRSSPTSKTCRLWNYAIAETREITDGPVGVGSRYRQTRRLPTRSEETFAVTELTLRIPVAEQTKPRKVEVTAGTDAQPAISTSG
jgi:hypothetical protein